MWQKGATQSHMFLTLAQASGSPLGQSHMVPTYYSTKAAWPSPGMAATPGFKSQHQSSSAAPFPTPPTISYTCQHSSIYPAFLGCHSKSRKVWPNGMEPIISKLSRRPCNQGELLPSSILVKVTCIPLAQSGGHSYLTHP